MLFPKAVLNKPFRDLKSNYSPSSEIPDAVETDTTNNTGIGAHANIEYHHRYRLLVDEIYCSLCIYYVLFIKQNVLFSIYLPCFFG